MPSILFMGISSRDPGFPLPPTVSPEALDDIVNKATKSMTDAGYTVNLFLPLMAEGIARLQEDLTQNKYDAIIVGVGLRTAQPLAIYFEQIVNTCIEKAPGTRLAFNESLDKTLEAAKRAVPL